ncbi:MAG: carboxyl transferase domain-containing protein [Pseudomonadota bacterium]
MSQGYKDWQALLAELDARTARAMAMGGKERIARQHDRGRMTARERIAAFSDPDSFAEIGTLAGSQHPGGADAVPADALVGGTARVNGRDLVLMVEDFTVLGGSIGHVNAAKRARLVRLADELSVPLVMMLEGAGERAGNTGERYPMAPSDLQLLADLRGKVPVICLVLGSSAGHGALCGMFADLLIMTNDAALFSAGPPLVQAATGQTIDAATLGGPDLHARGSGVVHQVAASEAAAFDQARYVLSLLPSAVEQELPLADPPATEPDREDLLELIPVALNQTYDVVRVIQHLVDAGSFFELQPEYGASLVIGLARLNGLPCLVMANQPAVMAGAVTAEAARKATHFLQVGSRFGLPLLSLVDNPGVMPGPAAERAGVLREAAAMFAAQRHYAGRKIVVTLRKAFGFGSSVMGMNPWDHQVISLALPGVSLAGIPVIGGAEAAGADSDTAEQMAANQSGAWVPADAMAFDRVVDPRDLRAEICAAVGQGR